ncbi:DUF3126 family protein [Candidatus Liberibacter americanus]|uniref:DUF3126 domain-containing protein n=1 Tax=Candidatus Liberibacter americanus str. Sao Paulo TaxID=1261131 RepID=U6B6A3_9HYPH|nr:DUF3126 family protein [Candidatus Liberibacter americanus]AHA28304.1 hypothetical protein lam_974 [Candidatus Liberibacter americanus str. Sao Paulo]EMS36596.1 hypothetical protein G653_00075 [Candidatus Liberibacter americanus PW_SP]
MNPYEIKKLNVYFKRMFGSGIDIKPRVNQTDSVEVFINSEFIGLIYKDDEDGEISYNFSMSILNDDL